VTNLRGLIFTASISSRAFRRIFHGGGEKNNGPDTFNDRAEIRHYSYAPREFFRGRGNYATPATVGAIYAIVHGRCFRDITNFVALFCTFSTSSIFPFLYGHHTEFAYSKCGLTMTLYSKIKEGNHPRIKLNKLQAYISRILIALALQGSMCFIQ